MPQIIPAEPLTVTDKAFCVALLAAFRLYDLVDVDRDLIREEMAIFQGRWADTVGQDLAVLDDRQAIEDALAEALEID